MKLFEMNQLGTQLYGVRWPNKEEEKEDEKFGDEYRP